MRFSLHRICALTVVSSFLLLPLNGPGAPASGPRDRTWTAASDPGLSAAAAPTAGWAKTYEGFFDREGSKYFYPQAMQTDGAGGAFVAGWVELWPPYPGTGRGNLVVAQFGPTGDVGWTLYHEADQDVQCYDRAMGMIRLSDGGLLVLGDAGRDDVSDHEAIIIRIDPRPDIILPPSTPYDHSGLGTTPSVRWAKAIHVTGKETEPPPHWDTASAAAEMADGGFVVTGSGPSGFWLLKLDPEGNVLWHRGLGENPSNTPGRLQATPDGGFVIWLVAGANDILKFDGEGRMQWHQTIVRKLSSGGPANTLVWSVVPKASGGYFVCGSDSVRCGEHSCFAGGWLCQLDGAGNLVWHRGFKDFPPEFLISTDDGGSLATASSWNRMVKFDSFGQTQWVKALKNTLDDEDSLSLVSGIQSEDGGYMLAYNDMFYTPDENSRLGLIRLDAQGRTAVDCPLLSDASITPMTFTTRSETAPIPGPIANDVSVRPLSMALSSRSILTRNVCASDSAGTKPGKRSASAAIRK